MSLPLNQAQLHAVSSALAVVERALEGATAALDPPPGILTITEQTLDPATRAEVRRHLRALQAQLATLADELGCARAAVDVRGTLLAQLALAASTLEDVRPRRLRGYGAVVPELEATLEPRLVELIRRFEALAAFIGAAPPWGRGHAGSVESPAAGRPGAMPEAAATAGGDKED